MKLLEKLKCFFKRSPYLGKTATTQTLTTSEVYLECVRCGNVQIVGSQWKIGSLTMWEAE